MKIAINVLMIDDNNSIIEKTKKYFSSHAVINVVKTINNGQEGLDYIIKNSKSFDVIIMDIIMPKMDGISILEEMQKQGIKKNVIILTSYKKETTIKMVSEYDVDYYMLKPFDISALEKRILSIAGKNGKNNEKKNSNVEVEISKLLHSLGIPSHIRGYQYIRESVYIMYQNPDMIGGITKCIYPEIANRFETTASRVERAIRHAIEVSWTRGDYEMMEELFGHSVDYDRSKPTNSEFIATLADSLRLSHQYISM